jgi:hypothetical protein
MAGMKTALARIPASGVLAKDATADSARPYLAREYGVARYSRILGADFEAADQYYQRTRSFWGSVLTNWTQLFQAGLFRKLFEYADQLAGGETPAQPANLVIHQSLAEMGAPVTN